MEKIDLFLKYFSLFLLIGFGISMVVPSYIASSSPYSFCYEIVHEDTGFFINDVWHYQNSTSCTLIDESDYLDIKKSNTKFKLVAAFGLIGWFVFSPDFRDGLKDKIKKIKRFRQ